MLQRERGSWPPHSWGSRSHTTTHHSQEESSGRVISSLQRPLPDYTQHSDRQTSMPPVGFEPTFSAGERPQTYALDRAATGTVKKYYYSLQLHPPPTLWPLSYSVPSYRYIRACVTLFSCSFDTYIPFPFEARIFIVKLWRILFKISNPSTAQ